MGNKRALLVGSSFSAAPIYYALKKYGIDVSVCGSIELDPCHQYTEESHYVDYSNADDLLEVVERGGFDFLVPTCNDYSYISCAKIASEYKFPGYDSLEVSKSLHTKVAFRKITQELGIPSPKFLEPPKDSSVNSHDLHFPLLVKPVDSFSGRGITKITSFNQLQHAVSQAKQVSRVGDVILEEFLDGTLHSHSAFIQDGRVVQDFFVDEFCSVYPYQVNCSNHPSVLPKIVREAVRKNISYLVNALDLANGLIHTQFLANENKFWIIETMRRCPGDLYGNLISLSTGVDYADLFVRPFIGLDYLGSVPAVTKNLPCGRHTVSVNQSMTSFSFTHSIPAVQVDVVPLKISGDLLNAAPFDKLCILFAKYSSEEDMFSITPQFEKHIEIQQLGE